MILLIDFHESNLEYLKILSKGICQYDHELVGLSQKSLDFTKLSKLHLVDVWQSDQYPERFLHEVSKKFQSVLNTGRIEINRGFSTEVVMPFLTGYI